MIFLKILVCSYLSLMPLLSYNCEDMRQKKNKSSTIQIKSNIIGTPFDEMQKSIQPNFKSNNIEALYQALAILPRDEFENTIEYEKRFNSVPKGRFAFHVKDINVKYNSDTENFIIVPNTHYSIIQLMGSEQYIELQRKTKSHGSFIGSNAYGATRRVDRYENYCWGIAIPEISVYETFKFELPMKIDKAKIIKNRLKLLLIIDVGPGCVKPKQRLSSISDSLQKIATSCSPHTATIDSPSSYIDYHFIITPNNVMYWIFDSGTGEIVNKFDHNGKLLSTPIPPTE